MIPLIIGLLIIQFSSPSFSANGPMCKLVRSPSSKDLEEWHEEMKCRELPVGGRRQVSESNKTSPTGVKSNYLIHRKSKNSYEIQIPLNIYDDNFRGAVAKLFGLSKTATEAEMEKAIKYCTSHFSNYLKGPSGERVSIKPILSKDKKSIWHWGLETDVSIKDPNYRSHSKAYESDIDCQTILHELLHLTGLVDEYQENDNAERSKSGKLYDCRALGPDESIMSDQHMGFALAKATKESEGEKVFKVSAEVCGKRLNPPPDLSETCLWYTNEKFIFRNHVQIKDFLLRESSRRLDFDPAVPLKVRFRKVEQLEEIKPYSPLLPAHFRAMIYPGCKRKNSLYYKCAKFAYKTSSSESNLDCNLPIECRNYDWLK